MAKKQKKKLTICQNKINMEIVYFVSYISLENENHEIA